MWWPSYAAYRASPLWLEKRARVKKRDGWRCRACGSRWHLQVHHMTYRYPWGEEPDGILITLCDRCHEAVTRYIKEHKGETGEVQLTLRFVFETQRGLVP